MTVLQGLHLVAWEVRGLRGNGDTFGYTRRVGGGFIGRPGALTKDIMKQTRDV